MVQRGLRLRRVVSRLRRQLDDVRTKGDELLMDAGAPENAARPPSCGNETVTSAPQRPAIVSIASSCSAVRSSKP